MKQYAANLIYNDHPVGIIASNMKELKVIIKAINKKAKNKIEYLGLKECDFKTKCRFNPLDQIELFLKNENIYEINTQKALKLYAIMED